MLKTTKPPRCKVCRLRLDHLRPGQVVHEGCVGEYVRRLREEKAQRLAKAERQIRRKRKEAIKTIPDLIKEAQREFNSWTRERDKYKACISCGRTLRFSGGGAPGGDFDCGHFRSTGSAPHLRFDERNAHGQCKHCNRYLAGNVVEYRKRLALRLGHEEVEAIEADNGVHKWTREELIAIRDTYKAKAKELKARMA